jgi:hypothetical protein
MNTLRQVIRGCGYLPHVGEHPGTIPLVVLTVMITAAVGVFGPIGIAAGFIISVAFNGALYLRGAYERAELSDSIEKRTTRYE